MLTMLSFQFVSQAFVTLLVVIDPFAIVPAFVGLTRHDTSQQRLKMARRASIIAVTLLFFFAFVGDKLLDALGISEPAFRIAGGFLLLLAAIDMVVARGNALRAQTRDEVHESAQREDISVFPLAIPLIAGPGALTSTVVLMRQAEVLGFMHQFILLVLLVVVIGITYVSLYYSERLMKILGVTGTNVLTRVFGIILAALAVQSIINGVMMVIRKAIAG
jgi:multiple antibiotic resistance protein